MDDIFVYFVQLPGRINETVTHDLDGYTIVIDPRQSYDGIKRSYHHAMHHILSQDFEKYDVQEIEAEAHERKGM